MNYRIKEGFTLVKVCDTHILVAKRSLWGERAGIRPVPKKYAVCWTLMEKGKTSDEVVRSLADLFHKSQEEVRERFSPVFTNLANDGYLEEAEPVDS
ncbi:MAG: hypothetical protein IKE94_03855 [Aeriscardovia sp.]|nr:hypothetical protein [Aeriscardovia sp.]